VTPPLLVHIGYHKTASSWFQVRVFSNEACGFGAIYGRKGGHETSRIFTDRPLEFDAAAMRAHVDPYLQAIRDRGLIPVISQERYSGHIYSGGVDSKEIADRLYATFPDASILMVLREQRSMILSSYRQFVHTGGTQSLRRYLELDQLPRKQSALLDLRHLEYDRLLGYYRQLFGADRVLALPYERMRGDPRGFVSAILEFAGSPVGEQTLDGLSFENYVNTSRGPLAGALRRQANRLRRSEFHLDPFFAPPRGEDIAKAMERWGERFPLPAVVEQRWQQAQRDEVARAVGDRYVDSNRRLARMMDVDLAPLGWMV